MKQPRHMIPNASALRRVESDAATKADTRQHIGNDLNRLARADVCELIFLEARLSSARSRSARA